MTAWKPMTSWKSKQLLCKNVTTESSFDFFLLTDLALYSALKFLSLHKPLNLCTLRPNHNKDITSLYSTGTGYEKKKKADDTNAW